MFVDTHTHLNFRQFESDFDKVIKRAKLVGVSKIIVVGSDLRNSRRAIELAEANGHLYATVGLHPIHIKGCFGMKKNDGLPPTIWTDDYSSKLTEKISLTDIKNLCQSENVVALGEIGLDYHKERERPRAKKDVQKLALEGLIDLGKEINLPMIFHCREAIEDFFDIAKTKKNIKGVMHCFQGDVIDAKRAIELGLLLSFTGLITFNRATDEVIKYLPLEKMMIETDCPFLTPEPHRGERNEPAYVVEVARIIAEIKNLPLYKVAEETTRNAIGLFGLEEVNSLATVRDIRATKPRQ